MTGKYKIIICLSLFFLFSLYGFTASTLQRNAPYKEAVYVGDLGDNTITEASGIASSRLNDRILWVVNDSGNAPLLYAVGVNGADYGRVRIANVKNNDWEDLASFRIAKTSYLLVADVGDNFSTRESVLLHIVREPDIMAGQIERKGEISVAWSIRFRYEDGPRDCESVAVDVTSGRILLLTKRSNPPVFYSLPLHPQNGKLILTARKLTVLKTIPQPQKEKRKHRHDKKLSQPTAMDITPDGTAAVILTYKDAYYFHREPGESWIKSFSRYPLIITLPIEGKNLMHQKEALCLGPDGKTIFTTSEGFPAPLYRIDPE